MVKLTPEQLTAAEALFAPLTGLHLSIAAVLAGAARGEVWVDDGARPRVGYAMTTEGHYLVGDAADGALLLQGLVVVDQEAAPPVVQQPFHGDIGLQRPVGDAVGLQVVPLGPVHGDQKLGGPGRRSKGQHQQQQAGPERVAIRRAPVRRRHRSSWRDA